MPIATTRRLEDHAPEELAALPYVELCALRRAAYRAHYAAMDVNDAVVAWAAQMAAKYGPKVKVHANALPWPIALLVVRYGEAIHVLDRETGEEKQFWPQLFTKDDVKKAQEWLAGQLNKDVVLLFGKSTGADGVPPFGLDEED